MPRRVKHPLLIIRGYRLFLQGSTNDDLKKEGIIEDEIQKIRQFHKCMNEGKYFSSTARALGIESHIAKKMLVLYEQNKAGVPLSYGGKSTRETYPHVVSTFSKLISGATHSEMLEKGCTALEIEKANEFRAFYANADMLSATISQRTGIVQSAVRSMLKIYRDRQKEHTESISLEEQPVIMMCETLE